MTLKDLLCWLLESPGRDKLQPPQWWLAWLYTLLSQLPSLSQFLTALLVFSGITSHINYLPRNSCLQVCIWGNQPRSTSHYTVTLLKTLHWFLVALGIKLTPPNMSHVLIPLSLRYLSISPPSLSALVPLLAMFSLGGAKYQNKLWPLTYFTLANIPHTEIMIYKPGVSMSPPGKLLWY